MPEKHWVHLPLHLVALKYAQREYERGVSETDGPNDSPAIREYLEAAEIGTPAPWCAAFIQWAAERAAMLKAADNPLEAVRYEAYVPSYVDWAEQNERVVRAGGIAPGDLFCLWHNHKKRYAHMGLVARPGYGSGEYQTIEGNSNEDGDREGIRVAVNRRPVTEGTLFIRWDGKP